MVLIFISPDCNYRGDAMSITNKLNQIKNAIYGKEVRGAIHDAIKQVYDDASVNHDNANMEVRMARGTHNTLNDRLDNVDEIQAQTNAQLSQKINVEKNRIDSLTTLAEGSTTGDAELMDIRIGANGFIYNNSGTAVRHQISTVNHVISEVSKKLINCIALENNYRNGVGFDKNNGTNKVIDYAASNIKSTSFDVCECEEFTVKTTIGNNWYGVIYSDQDNNFIGGALKDSPWQTYENFEIVIPPKCTKLLINCESTKEVIIQRKSYDSAINEEILDSKINEVKTRTGTSMKTINRLGYRENGGNENTMFAFKEAVKKGYNILLCDVRFTSDNIGVSLHDSTINRTARNVDGSIINNTINIKDITLQQANQYDYGISGGVSEVGIVTIEMLVKFCKMTNCELYLEYKDGSFSQYDELFEMINRYGMLSNTTLTAGLNVLQRYGAKYPELRLGLNSSYSEENIMELTKLITDKNEVFLFGWDSDNLTTEQVKFMSANKVKYEFGNVNDVERLIELMNSNMVYATRVESDNLLIEEELYKYVIK